MQRDPAVLALGSTSSATVLVAFALLVSGRYGAAQVWPGPFYADPVVCEAAATWASVVRPVNAMASAAYLLGGIWVLSAALADATALLKSRPHAARSSRLLARVPAWSAAWGAWLAVHGGTSFTYFCSGAPEHARLMLFTWWALGAHVVAYAWARFLLDRPQVHEVGCGGCVCVVHVFDEWWMDRYVSGCMAVCVAAVDAGAWFLADDGQWAVQAVALAAAAALLAPIGLHYHLCWREHREAWGLLGWAAVLAVAALALRLADSAACDPQSRAQAYGAWQVFSAAALAALFAFLRAGDRALEYVVIVQSGDAGSLPAADLRGSSRSLPDAAAAPSPRASLHSQARLSLVLDAAPPASPRGSVASVRSQGSSSSAAARRPSLVAAGGELRPGSGRRSLELGDGAEFASGRSSGGTRPGMSRRSMEGAIQGLAEEQNATLRLLSHVSTSSRSVEAARASSGVGLDARLVAVRSPEEAGRARRASIEAALAHRPPAGSMDHLTLPERLAIMRSERLSLGAADPAAED